MVYYIIFGILWISDMVEVHFPIVGSLLESFLSPQLLQGDIWPTRWAACTQHRSRAAQQETTWNPKWEPPDWARWSSRGLGQMSLRRDLSIWTAGDSPSCFEGSQSAGEGHHGGLRASFDLGFFRALSNDNKLRCVLKPKIDHIDKCCFFHQGWFLANG